jgi:hypothetical protein
MNLPTVEKAIAPARIVQTHLAERLAELQLAELLSVALEVALKSWGELA